MPEAEKVGTKVEPGAEITEVGKTEALPDDGDEVGGRYRYENVVVCPYCGRRNHIVESSRVYRYYECWHCGGTFYR